MRSRGIPGPPNLMGNIHCPFPPSIRIKLGSGISPFKVRYNVGSGLPSSRQNHQGPQCSGFGISVVLPGSVIPFPTDHGCHGLIPGKMRNVESLYIHGKMLQVQGILDSAKDFLILRRSRCSLSSFTALLNAICTSSSSFHAAVLEQRPSFRIFHSASFQFLLVRIFKEENFPGITALSFM